MFVICDVWWTIFLFVFIWFLPPVVQGALEKQSPPLAKGASQGSLPALAAKKGVKVDSTRDLEAVLPTKVEIEDPHVGGLKPNKPPFWFFKISLRPRKNAIFSGFLVAELQSCVELTSQERWRARGASHRCHCCFRRCMTDSGVLKWHCRKYVRLSLGDRGLRRLRSFLEGGVMTSWCLRLNWGETVWNLSPYSTLYLHIAIENGPFIVDLPIESGDFP